MITIPVGRSAVALVDAADLPAVSHHCWHLNSDHGEGRRYAQRNVVRDGRRTTESLHTFLTGWARVDHIDGDGLNNRRSNLREATHGQNMGNRRPQGDRRFKGVYPHRGGRWVARVAGRHLGVFATEGAAAHAYNVAAVERWGEFARLNLIKQQDGDHHGV